MSGGGRQDAEAPERKDNTYYWSFFSLAHHYYYFLDTLSLSLFQDHYKLRVGTEKLQTFIVCGIFF